MNAGRYTVAVTDKSTTSGFMLQKLRHTATNVTTRTFVGKRSAKVVLTAGKWIFTPSGGKQAYTIAVVAAV